MKKQLILMSSLWLSGGVVFAQTFNDAERLRISKERALLEAGFHREDAACYLKFMVNNCLDEVRIRRQEAFTDLRRQEMSIDNQERKAKGAEQLQKTEDKASLEKQQAEADTRAKAMRDTDARMERERQKNADRLKLESNEKSNLETAAAKAKDAQNKQAGRTAKQAAAAEEVKKYNERLEKAKERQARIAKDRASQSSPAARPLPAPP
jgi:chromosome segregation ATPase